MVSEFTSYVYLDRAYSSDNSTFTQIRSIIEGDFLTLSTIASRYVNPNPAFSRTSMKITGRVTVGHHIITQQ